MMSLISNYITGNSQLPTEDVVEPQKVGHQEEVMSYMNNTLASDINSEKNIQQPTENKAGLQRIVYQQEVIVSSKKRVAANDNAVGSNPSSKKIYSNSYKAESKRKVAEKLKKRFEEDPPFKHYHKKLNVCNKKVKDTLKKSSKLSDLRNQISELVDYPDYDTFPKLHSMLCDVKVDSRIFEKIVLYPLGDFMQHRLAHFRWDPSRKYYDFIRKLKEDSIEENFKEFLRDENYYVELEYVSKYRLGGVSSSHGWYHLDLTQTQMLFQFNTVLSSMISILVDNNKEALVLPSVIFDRSEALSNNSDVNILSIKPHRDIQLFSADSWIVMIPIDYDTSILDGICIQKGKNFVHLTYHPDTMVVFGGDICHYGAQPRKHGSLFARSHTSYTQRRILQVLIAPNIALFRSEFKFVSYAGSKYSDVVFVVGKNKVIRTMNRAEKKSVSELGKLIEVV